MRFGILFLVLKAQMNLRLLKAALVDHTFMTGRSEKPFGIFSLTQILADLPCHRHTGVLLLKRNAQFTTSVLSLTRLVQNISE